MAGGSYNCGPVLTYRAEADIARYLRVKHGTTGASCDIAGDESFIGTARASVANGELLGVTDVKGSGTRIMVANGAIAEGADVSTAAGGKIQTGTLGAVTIGKAETAATADGDYVTVKPLPQ